MNGLKDNSGSIILMVAVLLLVYLSNNGKLAKMKAILLATPVKFGNVAVDDSGLPKLEPFYDPETGKAGVRPVPPVATPSTPQIGGNVPPGWKKP